MIKPITIEFFMMFEDGQPKSIFEEGFLVSPNHVIHFDQDGALWLHGAITTENPKLMQVDQVHWENFGCVQLGQLKVKRDRLEVVQEVMDKLHSMTAWEFMISDYMIESDESFHLV